MLFNSLEFILCFLPIVFGCFHLVQGRRRQLFVLLAGSLFFYGWWNPVYVPLLLFSLGVNFSIGGRLAREKSFAWLMAGIGINLCLLGYFKYAQFLTDSVFFFVPQEPPALGIVLPLAISFYTFQQISFLIDCYYRRTNPGTLLNYSTYVTFFPQLIAGPVVRHTDLAPQLNDTEERPKALSPEVVSGLALFVFGLFKKVAFADALGAINRPFFAAASEGVRLGWQESWWAVSTYTLQLYYDFSGYSDMAIGLALLFGLKLPRNFRSPYQASNILQFWARWHITLTSFFTQYLYLPLSLKLRVRSLLGHSLVTLFVMVVVGMWHGAGWNFLIWGGIHGIYLVVGRAIERWKGGPKPEPPPWSPWGILGRAKVFLLLAISYPFFRLETFDAAKSMTWSLVGGIGMSSEVSKSTNLPIEPIDLALFIGLLAITWWAPTSHVIAGLSDANSNVERRPLVRFPALLGGAIVGLVLAYALIRIFVGYESEFIYFQF